MDHAVRRLAGDVIIHSSLPRFAATLALAAVVVFAGVLLATATYARKETVAGWLTPSSGLIRLSARQGGVIEAIHVAEGQDVKAGEPIATIQVSAAIGSGDSYAVVSRSMNAQVEATEKLAASQQASLKASRAGLKARRAMLIRELEEARGRVDLAVSNAAVAQRAFERAAYLLEQGAMSRREHELEQSTRLQADAGVSQAKAETLRIEREIGTVDADLAALPFAAGSASAEAENVRASLAAQRAEAEAAATYIISATVDGRIAALPVHVGDSVLAGGLVAMMTPSGAVLEAELLAPSRVIGFVEPGQRVRLMYQAFPHQKFGAGLGVVRSVSRTVLAPEDTPIPGLKPGEPVFVVRVGLETDHVSGYGREIQLQPGLLLTADVVLDRRSLGEWLLDPLFAMRGRS